jgi:poly-gamma-glutamate synthesis protein (capsule biosynthesis protein)
LALGLKGFVPSAASAELPPADLQFFGDVYVTSRMIGRTGSTAANPAVFGAVRPLLATATHNILNFEGVATDAFIPYEDKSFLLRMPLGAIPILAAAGFNAATLANNHAMDYGFQGLIDTMLGLHASGIAQTGAGRDLRHATTPLMLDAAGTSVCLLAFSRVFPDTFWATMERHGTAHLDYEDTVAAVKRCTSLGLPTVVSFHWGQELSKNAAPYQRALAHLVIDAGAVAVIGHHPHVLQEIETYKSRMIFYSIGNFAFDTLPPNRAEGMAVRLRLANPKKPGYDLIPLSVHNAEIGFVPRPLTGDDDDPIEELLETGHKCRFEQDLVYWSCNP